MPPDTFLDEMTEDHSKQARKPAERTELRIITPVGAELAADAISLMDFQACNAYMLAAVGRPDDARCYVVRRSGGWCSCYPALMRPSQVKLYAEFATPRLIDLLRANNDCIPGMRQTEPRPRDGVPPRAYGQALTLIIEKLGDVHRAIDFTKEQNDDDLWEDLLRCQAFLNGHSADFARTLHRDQTAGFFVTAKTACPICARALQETPQAPIVLFLCRHVVHAACARGGDRLSPPELGADRGLRGKIVFKSVVARGWTRGVLCVARRTRAREPA
ncbi:hypothetical protein FB451DRAFT_1161982 [Mycena latifolia]|nr:hypothetical protein FB451DRAFT_1161982 [Mycena latifolia]